MVHRHWFSLFSTESIVRASGLAERSFKRRFKQATGFTPIAYLQHLRVEASKRQLKSNETSELVKKSLREARVLSGVSGKARR